MIYWIGWSIFKVIFSLIYRRKIIGLQNIPQNGSYILAANHMSNADPPLVGSCISKPIHYIAKKELFNIPVFGWMISKANAFPVDRENSDMGAFRKALEILKEGKTILFFPEGTRYKAGKTRKPKNGAAMLSVLTNSPVIPVAINNSDKLLKFKRLKVSFGVPMKFDSKEDYNSITAKIMKEIEKLKQYPEKSG
ncbi:MAG: hypothetical protein A2474_08105 [Elusimicrobia bacterium RIFOXYC2_FULL_34_12]|nr:MAG: hypothetical protein A2474_08105 [Elusimicrobia bacterium RIFOXYC2_FULL_34_12]OGS39447.1 MAG: hypothetical protein A2551_07595 [Elusimicrobia bacterium RIFOXYD2_FULL_34_30]HAM39239.1 1-acyl-sn-glycerol-3-phosphate acyltransferase [Elusimicrobiota bacterium]